MNQLNHNNESRPPIGGADLECTLAYDDFEVVYLEKMAAIILAKGFELRRDLPPFFAYGKGLFEHLLKPETKTTDEFFTQLKNLKCRTTLINFQGRLFDIDVYLSISYDLAERVVQITTIEDFIWEFRQDTSKANFNRLKAYGQICQAVCSVRPPLYARMATEATYADEFTVEKLREENSDETFNDTFFSETRLRELYDWYINTYTKRWEHD